MEIKLSIGTKLRSAGIFFLFSVIFAGCDLEATQPTCANLVQRWDQVTYYQFILTTPFLARFRFNRGTLRYVTNRQKEPRATFNLVFRTVESFPPDLVILEGLESSLGVNPEEGKRKFIDDSRVRIRGSGWVGDFAAFGAYSKAIDFMGGDPSLAEVLATPLLDPYTRDDRAGFLLLRDFLYHREKQPKLSWQRIMRNSAESFGFKEGFNPEYFINWFETRTGHAWYPESITYPAIEVDCTPKAKFLRRLACEMIWFRDVHLVELLNQQFDRYRNILVVYGAGHYVQQRDALEANFGPATVESP